MWNPLRWTGWALMAALGSGCPSSSNTQPERDSSYEPAADGGGTTTSPRDASAEEPGPKPRDAGPDASSEEPETSDASTGEPGPEAPEAGVDASEAELEGDAGSEGTPFVVSAFTPDREIADPTAPLRVTLSAAVDPSSLSASTFVVTRAGRPVEGDLSADSDSVEFRPRPAWALAASYDVVLTAELRDVEGRTLTPHAKTLRVREGRWTVEQRAPARQQPRSDLAVAPNGVAAVAWVDSGVQLSMYTPESGWTAAERVSDETEAVLYPSLAINAHRQLVASWNFQVNPTGRVFLPDRGWQPQFYFRGVPGGGQEVKRASWLLSDTGSAVGVFSVYRLPPAERGTVDAITFDVASETRDVHAISRDDPGYDLDPQLTWLGDEPLFVWVEDARREPGVPRPEVWVRRGITGESRRVSSEQHTARSPAIAATGDRSAAWLVWEEVRGSEASLWAAKLTADATLGAPEPISQPFAAGDREANPVLAIDASGAAHVVWEQPSAAIWTARFDPERGWQPSAQLSAAEALGTQPSIALEPGGNAAVVWVAAQRGSGTDTDSAPVMTSRYLAGTGWSAPSELASGERGASMVSDRVGLSIGLDHSGRGWASWTGNSHFQLARFE